MGDTPGSEDLAVAEEFKRALKESEKEFLYLLRVFRRWAPRVFGWLKFIVVGVGTAMVFLVFKAGALYTEFGNLKETVVSLKEDVGAVKSKNEAQSVEQVLGNRRAIARLESRQISDKRNTLDHAFSVAYRIFESICSAHALKLEYDPILDKGKCRDTDGKPLVVFAGIRERTESSSGDASPSVDGREGR